MKPQNKKTKIARSNSNILCRACLSFFEISVCQPIEIEPNLLAIVNTLLALKQPDNLLKWLGSGNNLAKLIRLTFAVCKNYDELAADYNILVTNQDQTQEALTKKQGVICYLQNQNTSIFAKIDILCKIQKLTTNPPVFNLSAVNLHNNHAN